MRVYARDACFEALGLSPPELPWKVGDMFCVTEGSDLPIDTIDVGANELTFSE
jgi:hypothetical protein